MRRALPPLLLLAVLALVAWLTLQRPAQRAEETRIASLWEARDAASRAQVLALVEAYARAYAEHPNPDFLAQAYLRCRRVDLAVRARWPALEPAPAAAEVRAFARQALRALGWDDEAQRRPSLLHAPATVALLDGGDPATLRVVEERLAVEPIEGLYALMRQSSWERSAPTRRVLARACRARAAAEPAEQALDVPWKVAAALIEVPGAAGAHEQADRDLLISFLEGPARVQFRGRWLLATRALGQSGHPDALASLRRMADRLATSQDPTDRHDRAALLLGRVAGGDWEGEIAVRAVLLEGHEELRRLTSHAVGILAERALAGDERAQRWLEEVWAGPAAEASAVREIVASALLGDAPPVAAGAWVEPMVQDLERPRTPPAYHVHALVHRLRQGQAAARGALLAWLIREAGEGVLEGADPERSTIPALIALRALDRAP